MRVNQAIKRIFLGFTLMIVLCYIAKAQTLQIQFPDYPTYNTGKPSKYDWRVQKLQLEKERKYAERLVGVFKRAEDEYIEFYISKESKYTWFRGRFIGIGKFDYEFAASEIEFQGEGNILFRIKGKLYKAKRIDESLEITDYDGIKKYCPLVTNIQLPKPLKYR